MGKHSMNSGLAQRLLDGMGPNMRRNLYPDQKERCRICGRMKPLNKLAYTTEYLWACRSHPGILDIEAKE